MNTEFNPIGQAELTDAPLKGQHRLLAQSAHESYRSWYEETYRSTESRIAEEL